MLMTLPNSLLTISSTQCHNKELNNIEISPGKFERYMSMLYTCQMDMSVSVSSESLIDGHLIKILDILININSYLYENESKCAY